MKHRVRQAVFNRIGDAIEGKHAVDLFAGSGALGLEAISRGAVRATLIERHVPTARILRENVSSLQLADRAEVLTTSAFLWGRQPKQWPNTPWIVFCSPPYELYVAQADELIALIEQLTSEAPAESIFVVEADERFDCSRLPRAEQWEFRLYPPAVVGILRT
jgi:16S rRNA (guanine966-N2)-methyltransferase